MLSPTDGTDEAASFKVLFPLSDFTLNQLASKLSTMQTDHNTFYTAE